MDVFTPGTKTGLVVDLSVIIRAHAAFISPDDKCFDGFVKRVLKDIATLGAEAKADRIDMLQICMNHSVSRNQHARKEGWGSR